MAFVLIIIGIALLYFGINRKIGSDKPLGEMTAAEAGSAGCSGYLKIMMIASGIGFILMGVLIKIIF